MIDTMFFRSISRSFLLLLLCMTCCMACLAGFSLVSFRGIEEHNKAHALCFVPAKRMTANFEREILNARIFFIYFVTIQKPGSLPSGWERYHNAEAQLRDIGVLISQHEELQNLQAPVAQLQKDVANYGVALAAILNIVDGGELHGPNYDAHIKEWAARGAVMVKDASSLEKFTFNSSEADTARTANSLHQGQTIVIVLFLGGFLISLLLTLLLSRRISKVFYQLIPPLPTPLTRAMDPTFSA